MNNSLLQYSIEQNKKLAEESIIVFLSNFHIVFTLNNNFVY